MKKFLSIFLIICVEFTALAAASKYYTGTAGSNMILAIPEARGVNLPSDQEYFQVLLQTQLTDAIKKYSPIQVVDRQNEDIIDEEIAKSENGSYSDTDYVEFGKKVNAKFVLIAQLINTDESYNLSVRINETETNTTKYSYADNKVYARTIKNGMAVNMAVKDLLSQIGVQLTSEGLKEINGGVDENTLKAQENLSKGINASHRGTTVEALQYYYAAAEYSIDSKEINARLNSLQIAVSSGNLGDLARSEDEVYEYWEKTLSEADDYFTKNPPYAIVHSTKLDRIQRTSEELKNKENTLSLQIGLVASNNSKKTIAALMKGIESSPSVVKDAIDWPRYSQTTGYYNEWLDVRNCQVTIQLVNDVNKVIAENKVSLNLAGPSLTDSRAATVSDLDSLKTVYMSNIKSDEITDNITIKIAAVNWNGVAIPTDNIRIATVDELKNKTSVKSKVVSDSKESSKKITKENKVTTDITVSVPSEKDLKRKYKQQKKALNKRTALYITADVAAGDYFGNGLDSGFTFGYDHKLFGNIFYGFNFGMYYEPIEMNFDAITMMGEIGFAIGLSPNSEFYYKYCKGYGLGTRIYPGDVITRHCFGYDWGCFEFEYSFDHTDYSYASDKLSIGLVFNKSWLDN